MILARVTSKIWLTLRGGSWRLGSKLRDIQIWLWAGKLRILGKIFAFAHYRKIDGAKQVKRGDGELEMKSLSGMAKRKEPLPL